jgi:hypothetical protein
LSTNFLGKCSLRKTFQIYGSCQEGTIDMWGSAPDWSPEQWWCMRIPRVPSVREDLGENYGWVQIKLSTYLLRRCPLSRGFFWYMELVKRMIMHSVRLKGGAYRCRELSGWQPGT